MMKTFVLLFYLMLISSWTFTQSVTVLPSGISPSPNTLFPRLSYDEMIKITSPNAGDIVFDKTFQCLRVYDGINWVCTFQNPAENKPNIGAIAKAKGTSPGQSVAVDQEGNIYVTGYYSNEVDFNGIIKTSSALYGDAYIIKLNNLGEVIWVRTIESSFSSLGNCIYCDDDGNVYVGGNFAGIANFGNGIIKQSSNVDGFIAKYDSTGIAQWVQTTQGNYQNNVQSIIADKNGNIYYSGYYTGTITLGSNTYTSNGNYDIITVKSSVSGIILWAKTAGGSDIDLVRSITLDLTGNIIIAGGFKGSSIFGNTTKLSNGDYDIFIAKYNNNGILQWVQTFGSVNGDNAWGVTTDSHSNIVYTGTIGGTVNFGSLTKSVSTSSAFIAQCSGNGSSHYWVQTVEKASGTAITKDNNNNIFVTGNFSNTITFGQDTKQSKGLTDAFILKLNNTGLPQWLETRRGINIDGGNSVFVDSNNKIYLTGYCSYLTRFGATQINALGSENFFLVRVQE